MTDASDTLSNRPVRGTILPLTAVVVAACLALSANVADVDLWGHVQYGRDVLREGRLPATTTYSYTAEGYPWINHENLCEIGMAAVVDTIGPLGLVWGKFLLGLALIYGLVRGMERAGIGMCAAAVLTLLVAANLAHHWSFRPQLATFAGFAMLVALLNGSFAGWRDAWHWPWPRRSFCDAPSSNGLPYDSRRLKQLWLAVPLFFLWANAHGGFLAGLLLYWVYLALRAAEALIRRRGLGWGLVRRMALMGTVAGLATLVNPYGWRLHAWLMASVDHPRPEIEDWAALDATSLLGMRLVPLLAVVLFSLVASRRRLDLTQLTLLALTLWQSVEHTRHIPFFAILAGSWIGPHFQAALSRVFGAGAVSSRGGSAWMPEAGDSPSGAKRRWPGSDRHSPVMEWGAAVLWTVAVGAAAWRVGGRLTDLPVLHVKFPVAAIDFMHEHQLGGRIVVTYDWAQYVIAALCADPFQGPNHPRSRVAFDGRFDTCYPQTLIDVHFDFLYGDSPSIPRYRSPQSPDIDPWRILEIGRPNLVLIRRSAELTEPHMRQRDGDWVLLYQDAISQLWGRRSQYDDPSSPAFFPPDSRRITNRAVAGSTPWPAVPYAQQGNNPNPPRKQGTCSHGLAVPDFQERGGT